MKFTESNMVVTLTGYDSFDIEETLECGQCFRFIKKDEKSYIIFALNKALSIEQVGDKTFFSPCNLEEFKNIWLNYFDLERDYIKIKTDLAKKDKIVKDAISYAEGIRILNQDIWECLISFIISQNNRIPIIKQVIQNLCEKYGEPINDEYYSFPTWQALNNSNIDEIMLCKTGFRAKYILDASTRMGNGTLDLYNLKNETTARAKDILMSIHGVGPKVSDCVLLFSNGRHEVFPIDVWVKRIMQELYLENETTTITKIQEFAREHFGEYAGFAQQYLFHYARNKKIGSK